MFDTFDEDEAVLIQESSTEFYIPKEIVNISPPPKVPAFYNSLAHFKRDILVSIINGYSSLLDSKIKFADIMCGVGVSGIRIAKECSNVNTIIFNDLNPVALKFTENSIIKNNLEKKCQISKDDANHFLSHHSLKENRFDFIDIDPFGTPVPYLDSSIRAININGIISMTATDGAVLCGVYPKVALRKYGSESLHTEYAKEIGVRILFGALGFSAARYNLGIEPVFCHVDKHYLRIYARIISNFSVFDKFIGYIFHCLNCGFRSCLNKINIICNVCSSSGLICGPLWIGPIFDKEIISHTLKQDIPISVSNLLALSLTEISLPSTYYETDNISQILNISSFAVSDIIDRLTRNGFLASRTIFSHKGFRTDATFSEIKQLLS
jgi:tRNA (guanine26-N2/guanine27-N2)-dimethyltransferase